MVSPWWVAMCFFTLACRFVTSISTWSPSAVRCCKPRLSPSNSMALELLTSLHCNQNIHATSKLIWEILGFSMKVTMMITIAGINNPRLKIFYNGCAERPRKISLIMLWDDYFVMNMYSPPCNDIITHYIGAITICKMIVCQYNNEEISAPLKYSWYHDLLSLNMMMPFYQDIHTISYDLNI